MKHDASAATAGTADASGTPTKEGDGGGSRGKVGGNLGVETADEQELVLALQEAVGRARGGDGREEEENMGAASCSGPGGWRCLL